MATLDDLWGGQLTSVYLDPIGHKCCLEVKVVDGKINSYRIECEAVADLRFYNAIPLPWSYADVTEVHMNVDGHSGHNVLEFILWSEDAGIVIRCASVQVQEAS